MIIDIVDRSLEVFSLGNNFNNGCYSLFDYFNGSLFISYSEPTTFPQYFIVPYNQVDSKKELILYPNNSLESKGFIF